MRQRYIQLGDKPDIILEAQNYTIENAYMCAGLLILIQLVTACRKQQTQNVHKSSVKV